MSAPVDRRGILALFGTVSAAAAAGGASPAGMVLGRLRPGFVSGGLVGASRALAPAMDAAHPLEREIPAALSRLTSDLESDASTSLTRMRAEARAIAALATVFPAEIAAPRSFSAPLRRRLYAELLTRESAQLAAAGAPPPTPPASPGPGA